MMPGLDFFYILDSDYNIPEHDNFYDSTPLLSLNNVTQLITYTRTDLFSDLTFPCPSFITGCGSMTKHFNSEIQTRLITQIGLLNLILKLIIELLIIILIFFKYND